MEEFSKKILTLKQETNQITVNPVLDAIDLKECQDLESFYETDSFIRKKIENALKYLEGLNVAYDRKFNKVYEEYSEAMLYKMLKDKGISIKHIQENSHKTPDFNVRNNENDKESFDINLELKSLSFLDGNINYKNAQEEALNAKAEFEKRSKTQKVAFCEFSVCPMNKNGHAPTVTELIQYIINKIKQNIKKGQYEEKDTILVIDTKQIGYGATWKNSSIAIYDDPLYNSKCSGVLWNISFGKEGNLIYQPIEFEGKSNIAGTLLKDGILNEYPYISALIFICYENFINRKFVSFVRNSDSDKPFMNFLCSISDFINDDLNSYAFKILEKEYNKPN